MGMHALIIGMEAEVSACSRPDALDHAPCFSVGMAAVASGPSTMHVIMAWAWMLWSLHAAARQFLNRGFWIVVPESPWFLTRGF